MEKTSYSSSIKKIQNFEKIRNSNLDQPIRPLQQVFHLHIPHPSQCRGNPYSQDTRKLAFQNDINGNNNNPIILQLQQQHKWPHPNSVQLFVDRQETVRHSRAYLHTGNNRAERKIEGTNLIHLSLYRVILLKDTAVEVNAYLYELNSHDPGYTFFLLYKLVEQRKKSI